ncbi:MAG: SAM-dependent methyltransferase [Microbacterium sp. SCN 70-27]|uniref:class I SAM-dependent methyltransferase n=1 Tax=unclassified Microbacterium TaxID=2609290 RepID=UPI000869968F|nr:MULTISPECIES: class I SAM-dependent methyltransferase [unclassified Microbacterium]MBN9224409.1 class I SAM-dependent methyltransferase [Microbacterium sp.]ODT28416.1 MAG: SAM-dependent methyltransferase [Microbacterium sp. SCN 70-27]
MDRAELDALLTPEGLRLVDEAGAIDSTDAVASAVSRLRAAGHSPQLVSAVVGQARLRTRARQKFGAFADRMLFTRAGLEQATRLEVGARHAGRFRDAGVTRVADLGCGIGGDALALAGIGLDVLAVDADEITSALAAYNLAPFGDGVSVRSSRAEDVDLTGIDAVWLDPARRTAGHGETTRVGADDWSPPLDWVFGLSARLPAGIKLGPAFDRSLIPDDAEAQWISVDGSTIELVVWTGILARPGVRRAALVIRGGQAAELVASGDAPDAPVRGLGAYLHEPEGAVIRARLIGEVARTIGAGMLDQRIAYLTSDAPASSPFVQTFRVREQLPNDIKALGRALRDRGIGTLEIKKRGVDIDPAVLRTKLKPSGAESATLFVTRIGNTRTTLLADRV